MSQTNPSPRSPSDEAPASPSPSPPGGDLTGPDPATPRVRVIVRAADGVVSSDGIDAVPARPQPAGAIVWVDVAGASADQVGRIASRLGLHELIVEDIVERNQRAKIEVTDDLVHVVMFALRYGDPIVAIEIDIVLGEGFLLTVHGPGWDPVPATTCAGRAWRPSSPAGPDHLLWALATTSWTATSRSSTGSATRSTLLQDDVVEHGHDADPRAALRRSSASSSDPPGRWPRCGRSSTS